ncbi:hypothetical protein FKM82_030034 [Ascaphus truei]
MAANLFLEVGVEESPLKSMAPLTYNGKPPLLLSDAPAGLRWKQVQNRQICHWNQWSCNGDLWKTAKGSPKR